MTTIDVSTGAASASRDAVAYVQPYPGPGGRVLVSTDGGSEPLWAHSGRALFYRNGEKMMVLDIQTQPILRNGSHRMLFERKAFPDGSRQWDVALDDPHLLCRRSWHG